MQKLFLIITSLSLQMLIAMEADLVQISSINPRIKIDLIWASGKNHLGLVLYPKGAECYLHKPAVYALDAIQKELEPMGYGLKIFEAFRPLWAQQKIWDFIKYLPVNQNQGRHTLGLAVDLTIINLESGEETDMPPYIYDDMAAKPIPITEKQKTNSLFLRTIMMKHNFLPMTEEWFHFDYCGWNQYTPLNKEL